jgi:asparagine N-glycosylation enzyme membrane subunit Stt3
MTNHRRWLPLLIICLGLGLYFRVAARHHFVFTPTGVNLQETDAWFHAHLAEAFNEQLPTPTQLDPYATMPHGMRVEAGPLLDLLVVAAVKLTGLPVFTVCAWCPVVLWLLLLVVVFLLARSIFGPVEAVIATSFAAVLAGNYMRVSSLGFHDHHVLESLLCLLTLLLLSRERHWWAGLALAGYLITFLGGAILVAFLIFWRVIAPSAPSHWRTLLTAFILLLPFYQTLWMEYSFATLAAALALELLFVVLKRPLHRWLALGSGAILASFAASQFGVFTLARMFSVGRGAATVHEMQWLTPATAFLNFSILGPAMFFAAWPLLRSANPFHRLIIVLCGSFAIMGWFQLRLAYYTAPLLAIVGGYVFTAMQSRFRNPSSALLASTLFLAATILPAVYSASASQHEDHGVAKDWREAAIWLRTNTPEPLPQIPYPTLLPFARNYHNPPTAYGILAWWEFGYTIETLAHRIPFTNPTQHHAKEAAQILLSTTDAEFRAHLARHHLPYAAITHDIPFLFRGAGFFGRFENLVIWADQRAERFTETVNIRESTGAIRPATVFYPDYFKTAAVRLLLYGTREYVPTSHMCVLTYAGSPTPFMECYDNAADLAVALRSPGTVLVSDNPEFSCIPLPAWQGLERVYQSRESIGRFGGVEARSLQIYRLQPAHTSISSTESQ